MVFALFSVAVTVLTHLYVVNVAISSCLPYVKAMSLVRIMP